jgi:transcription antitermination factor NusG
MISGGGGRGSRHWKAGCRQTAGEELKMNSETSDWYALQVQSRLASIASATLRGKGYEEYLPVYRSRRRWSDRLKEVELPLFPGYLFCRLNPRDRLLPVLTTLGVIGIVGAGKIPLPVAEEEIEAVRSILSSGLAAQPWPFARMGAQVRIEHGPLRGLEGVVTSTDKVHRLVVSVTLLQRSVAVEIDSDWARPVANSVAPNGQRAETRFAAMA